MDAGTFRDPGVVAALGRTVAVRVSIDDAKELAFEFKVASVPWILVLDPARREKLAEQVGYAAPEDVLRLVDEALSRFRPVADAAGPRPREVQVLYKRTGLSFESREPRVVVDLWSYLLVEAVAFTDPSYDGETARLRQSRVGIQATLGGDVTAIAQFDFAQTNPLLDAFGEYQVSKPLNLRAGRFKVPMGAQFLPRRDFWDFVEPSWYVLGLLPRRDVGAMVYGGGGAGGIYMKYFLGAFNGVQDGTADADDDKDLAARATLTPFPSADFDLSLSASGTWGRSRESLSAFRILDEGVTTILRFPATAALDGPRRRLALDGECLWGSLSLGAEFVAWRARIRDVGVPSRTREMRAASAWVSWIVTGEAKGRDEWLEPRLPIGAIEVVARFSAFRADRAIGNLAAPGVFAEQAEQYAVGVNWTPVRHVRVLVDYVQSRFERPVAVVPGDVETRNDAFLAGVEFRF